MNFWQWLLNWLKHKHPKPQSPIPFSEFAGCVNPLSGDFARQMGLGWCRIQVYWPSVQPTGPATWDWSVPDSFVDQCVKGGLEILANVAYTPAWAGDGQPSSVPKNPDLWVAFVKAAITRYPVIQFFQIWNEPTKEAGFWQGTDEQFVDLVYNPAAKAIRAAGKEVVFGGWPQSVGVQRFLNLLAYHGCAGLTDVLDLHYYDVSAYPQLSKAYPGKPIWQSEVGDTGNPGFLTSLYESVIAWAKASGEWTSVDQYRLFWYAAWGTNNSGLLKPSGSSNVLTGNGQEMAALAKKYAGGI